MVQKNIPYLNKSGYSMFWNSMWDNKNNYSKYLQKDFFIKSFINSFFSDYLFNQFFYKFKKTDFNISSINNNYNFNILNKNNSYIYNYIDSNSYSYINVSKIWLFKYQNWVVIYFYIFSKENSFFLNKNNFSENNICFYNYLNNYYVNLYKQSNNKYIFDRMLINKYNF